MLLKTQTRPKNLLVVILAFALAFSCGCNSSPTASDSSGDAAPRNPDGITGLTRLLRFIYKALVY